MLSKYVSSKLDEQPLLSTLQSVTFRTYVFTYQVFHINDHRVYVFDILYSSITKTILRFHPKIELCLRSQKCECDKKNLLNARNGNIQPFKLQQVEASQLYMNLIQEKKNHIKLSQFIRDIVDYTLCVYT